MGEDELFDLPEDAEEAFPIFEHRLRERYLEDEFRDTSLEERRQYATNLIGFCDAYEIDLGTDLESLLSYDRDEFFPAFNALEAKAAILAVKFRLSANRKIKAAIVPVYVLSPAQKSRIHKSLSEIRTVIAEADLSDQKRDALSKKLNAFAQEVDRDRTNGETLMAFYVSAKRELKEFSDISEQWSRIADVFSKAKDLVDALPAPKVPKLLEGPKTTDQPLPGFEDEIPF